MITENEFENLIRKNESSTLDFKKEFYDFKNDSNKVVTSKFVKDIISFSNTIRTETSYILFGVNELDNGKIYLTGLSQKFDEAILQDKIKDKVIPRPKFNFYTIHYQEKLFGILEFPICKYEMPIMPSVNNLKGLEAGKVYYRNGTSNTEATAYDIIRINDWLKSLPSENAPNSINEDVSNYLKYLTKNEQKLSVIFSELLAFSKKNNLTELREFCEIEIKGINFNHEKFKYRLQMVFISWNKIEVNPYSFVKPTAQLIKNEFENNNEFFEHRIILHHSIIEIESCIDRFGGDPNTSYAVLETNTKSLLGMKNKHNLFIYLFYDNFMDLYRNIRQKAIDILMTI